MARGKKFIKKDSFFYTGWRPACAWVYIIICVFDFIIFPIVAALYFHHIGQPIEHWKPLTLSEGGLFHIALGSVLGITSYGRSRERVSEVQQIRQGLQGQPIYGNDYGYGNYGNYGNQPYQQPPNMPNLQPTIDPLSGQQQPEIQ